ncbi:hypothetical protein ALC57_13020 [Trachymyrmex cornetzi]|uniref:Uncharacterized protein n=1 Tax=Trachymyrmex cornetzi TaxID=471704 RepID=A0A151J033_9HYME|nr:hypothetical protein ALC57_13020 [Trachymyrmex cornetzi]
MRYAQGRGRHEGSPRPRGKIKRERKGGEGKRDENRRDEEKRRFSLGSLHSYESASRIHHRTLTMALFMGLSRTHIRISNGHDGTGHGYLGTLTITVENFSAAIVSLCSLFESFWNVSSTCLPDFTIIADTSTKCRPKSFEDIAYLSTRCLICFETWTSTPSAGDNDDTLGTIIMPVIRSGLILSKVTHVCVYIREINIDDNTFIIAHVSIVFLYNNFM